MSSIQPPTEQELLKVAELVETTQKLADENDSLKQELEKTAFEKSAYDRLLPELVDTMVRNGIIDFHEKEATLKALQLPTTAIRVMTKLAKRVGPVDLGGPSEEWNANAVDDFTRFIIGG